MIQETVNPELFKWNRRRFAREMREESVAVFCSNDLVSSNGETHRRFRQNPDLYYLTGVTQPETVLVLAPGTARQGFEEVLFIRRPDQRSAVRRGPGLDVQQAAQISGIAQVCFVDELDEVLHDLILIASRVYVNSREDRLAYSEAPAADLRFAERLMKLYPAHKYHRAQPILKKIGMVKSAPEVGLIAKAIDLAHGGLLAAAREVRPGRVEHELEAAALASVVGGGAQGVAHPVRVASGAQTLYPDYDRNAGTLEEGEVVQLQVGVVYAGYHASLSRVIPVSGQFSAAQARVYEQLHALSRASIEALVPGATLPECEEAMRERLYRACDQLDTGQAEIGRHFPSAVYSHVGRNLRDPYQPYAPLQSGMVFAVEPALYLPGEGFGMQLRDIVLVTDEGPVPLTGAVPTAMTDIEHIVGVLA